MKLIVIRDENANFFKSYWKKWYELGRSRQRLSPSEVKEIALSSDPFGTLSGMLPGVGTVYSALKYLSEDMYLTAARNGWGLEYVIAVDRDNPTSTGIDFYWNYVK